MTITTQSFATPQISRGIRRDQLLAGDKMEQSVCDGSRSVTLYPSNGNTKSGPQIAVTAASVCVGCAWYDAAPYFSWVRSHFSSDGWGTYSGSTIHGYAASADLRFYQAPNTAMGMRVNGVAYAPLINNSQSTVLFRQVQTVLLPGERTLATTIFNYLLNQITG